MSERRATISTLAIIGGFLLLCYGFFVSPWVQMVVAVVVGMALCLPLVGLVYFGIRDALLRRGKPAADPYRDVEAW